MKQLNLVAALAVVLCACGSDRRAETASWTDPSPHQVQFVTVAPDVKLEVLDWGGSGPSLVFLSGLQDVAHGFDDFAPQFTDQHHVIAITRRGYGASSQTSSAYDMVTRVADLRAVLDSLRLERVALAGHSMAGDELTAFAGQYPDRVSHLIYLDAAYDHSGIGELIAASVAPPPMLTADSTSPAAVQAYLTRVFGMRIPRSATAGRRTLRRQWTSPCQRDSSGDRLADARGLRQPDSKAVRAPALVINAVIDSAPQMFPLWTALDSTTKAGAQRFTAMFQRWAATERAKVVRELTAAKLVELHGANHYVFDSHRDEVARAMRGFLVRDQVVQ